MDRTVGVGAEEVIVEAARAIYWLARLSAMVRAALTDVVRVA